MIRRLEKEPMDRAEAFRVALEFEGEQNERTLFDLLVIEPSDPAEELVNTIESDDSLHEQKIRDYAAAQGTEIDAS